MANMNINAILVGVMAAGLLVGCARAVQTETPELEGKWNCQTAWSYEKDGVTVPCAAEQQSSCIKAILSSTGVISIGDAQWDETIEGTCYSSDEELYGERTFVKTVPKNDAARQFEKETLEGKTLSDMSPLPQEFRVRITSRTEKQLTFSSSEGRVVTCTRPDPSP